MIALKSYHTTEILFLKEVNKHKFLENQTKKRRKNRSVNSVTLAKIDRNIDWNKIEEYLKCEYTYFDSGLGRPPKPPIAMLKSLLLIFLRGLNGISNMLRGLKENIRWRKWCGFENVPAHNTFSDFKKRIGLQALEFVFKYFLFQLREAGVIKGENICIDSTDIEAWFNEDIDADWGVRTLSEKERKQRKKLMFEAVKKTGKKDLIKNLKVPTVESFYGFKGHFAIDANAELPVTLPFVTPASANDSPFYLPLLDKTVSNGFSSKYGIADAQYDSIQNHLYSYAGYGIVPVIAPNYRNTKDVDAKRFDKRDYRNLGLKAFKSEKEWKQRYNLRTTAERVFSRLKEQLGLWKVKLKSLFAVTFFVWLACITLLLNRLAEHKSKTRKRLR